MELLKILLFENFVHPAFESRSVSLIPALWKMLYKILVHGISDHLCTLVVLACESSKHFRKLLYANEL